MNVAQLVVRCLENEGVRYVFGIPGEETLALSDALADSEQIRFITVRHEQGAAFMADVYGRLSSHPGVCLATLGPGATNLLTGVADANLDRAPLVAITGQAGLERAHKESHQYVDIPAMFAPVTKFSARITVPDATPEVMRKAFRLARLEKPGATHVELPEDVADQECDLAPMEVRRTLYPEAGTAALERAIRVIGGAARPLLLVGNGVLRRQARGRGAADALRDFVHASCIHAAHTFMAKGALDDADPLALPAVGLQRPGADLATVPALAEADVVITVGYDQVEWSPALWNPDRAKTIVHVDSTPAEIDGHYLPEVEVVGEIGESLRALAASVPAREHRDQSPHSQYPTPDDHAFPLRPLRVVADLRAALGDEDVVICDVGAHKVWLSRAYPTAKPNTVIVSNGFASMGIALPGAIAAKLVHPDRKVVAFCGDGGFLMNVQELETAKRLGSAIVVVVLVDDRYGVIEANQLRRFGRAASIEFGNPDFVALARAFGVAGHAVERTEDLLPTLRRALDGDGPAVVAVPIDHRENAKLADVLR